MAGGGNASSCSVGRGSVWRRIDQSVGAARADPPHRSQAGVARGVGSARGLVWWRIGPDRGVASATTLQRSSPAGVARGDGSARVSMWRRIGLDHNAPSATNLQRSSPVGVARGDGSARGSVWQPIGSGHEVDNTTPLQRPSLAGLAGDAGAMQGNLEVQAPDQGAREQRSSRRRRPRFRWRSGQGASGPAPASDPLPNAPSSLTSAIENLPPCIIDWSEHVNRVEADLAHAVIVTVIGGETLATAEDVAEMIEPRIAVEASSLVLRRASPSSYLLVLPNMALVDRLIGLELPCDRPVLVLPCCASVGLIDGGDQATLATLTVDHFLSPHAWVQQVHPDTLPLSDLSCFRCLAWSTNPSTLPSVRELWVVEPPLAAIEDPPVKRVLAYPVKLKFNDALHPDGLAPSPPSDERDDADEDSTRQQRRVCSPSPTSGASLARGGDQATSCNSGSWGRSDGG